jgi:NhaP-type Na+/H+ or K+/H+ antiporter
MPKDMKSRFAIEMLTKRDARAVRFNRMVGGVIGILVAVAIYAVADACHASGITATFVAGMLGVAAFQMFEPASRN